MVVQSAAVCLQSHYFDVLVEHHLHVAIIKHMGVVVVHEDEVRFVQLPSSMQMVYEPFSVFSKEELVDVALF